MHATCLYPKPERMSSSTHVISSSLLFGLISQDLRLLKLHSGQLGRWRSKGSIVRPPHLCHPMLLPTANRGLKATDRLVVPVAGEILDIHPFFPVFRWLLLCRRSLQRHLPLPDRLVGGCLLRNSGAEEDPNPVQLTWRKGRKIQSVRRAPPSAHP